MTMMVESTLTNCSAIVKSTHSHTHLQYKAHTPQTPGDRQKIDCNMLPRNAVLFTLLPSTKWTERCLYLSSRRSRPFYKRCSFACGLFTQKFRSGGFSLGSSASTHHPNTFRLIRSTGHCKLPVVENMSVSDFFCV